MSKLSTLSYEQVNIVHEELTRAENAILQRTGLSIRVFMRRQNLGCEPEELLHVIATALGMPYDSYRMRDRSRNYTHLRGLATLFLLRYFPELSYKKIGNLFGQDHASVINIHQSTKKLLDTNDELLIPKYTTCLECIQEWQGEITSKQSV